MFFCIMYRIICLIIGCKILQIKFCELNLDVHNKMRESDVRVYALSQGRASPDVIVLLLSHRDAQNILSYKKEPRREICGVLFI